MGYDIDSIIGLVDAFGGDSAVARWLGVTQPAVANWKARNNIPVGWHTRFSRRAKAEGLTINPVIFGFDDDGETAVLAYVTKPRGARRSRSRAA